MTQAKRKITDGFPVVISRGPSKLDLHLALIDDDKIVEFGDGRQTFYVRISGMKKADNNTEERIIDGTFRTDRSNGLHGKCTIRYWHRTRQGHFHEYVETKAKAPSMEDLNRLSDADLLKEISGVRGLAIHSKDDLVEYSRALSPRDRMIVGARLLQLLFEASATVHLDHQVLRKTGRKERPHA